jgi:hypothetical protein
MGPRQMLGPNDIIQGYQGGGIWQHQKKSR